MVDMLKDLSTITGVAHGNYQALYLKCNALIEHYMVEALNENSNTINVYMGIGNLVIEKDKGCIKYKFIPSQTLDRALKKARIGKQTDLTKMIDKELERRIKNTYKELL